MKINFGHGIALVLIAFVSTFVWLGIKAFSQTFELKTENYYEADQKFPDQMIRSQNAADKGWNAFAYQTSASGICWQLPDTLVASELKTSMILYRPSDQSLDKTFDLVCDSTLKVCLDGSQIAKGYYDVIFEITYREKGYRVEQKLFNQ